MSLLVPRDHYKPFTYGWAFDAYRTAVKMRWEPEEAPMGEDIRDWENKLTPQERGLLTQLFRFFTQGDVDVACAYRDRYMPAFRHPEIAMLLYEIASSESNHIYAYSLLLDTIGMPEAEYKAFHEFDEMRAKHEFLFKDRLLSATTVARLMLDIAVFSAFSEGMQLFSSFVMLLNFQRRGLMKGMSTIVEWSIRDESHHVACMTKLFHTLVRENPGTWDSALQGHVYRACLDMVALEDRFIDLAFSLGPVDGMTADDVKLFIRHVANQRLLALELKPRWVAANPFPWFDWLVSAPTHTNFFEQRSTDYGSGGSVTDWENAYGD